MAYILYWIHYPNHNDPYSQGYIGITGNFDYRKYQHENGWSGKHIHNRIKNQDHGFDILHECETLDEILELEKQYRPNDAIGWNLIAGGGNPPNQSGRSHKTNSLKGEERTEAQKKSAKEHSQRMKGRSSPRKGTKWTKTQFESIAKGITINGIHYDSRTEAFLATGISGSSLSHYIRKGLKEVKRKNGEIIVLEY